MMVEQYSCGGRAFSGSTNSFEDRALTERLRRQLLEGTQALGLSLSEYQQGLLLRYLALLSQWSAVYNLTALRDPFDMLSLHVLDSLSIVDLVGEFEGSNVLDVGTGAGLPGVPLAIALPQRSIRLVDAVGKKISFLRQAKALLKLSNIHPQHSRVEALTLTEKPDLIVSRAYADLTKMVLSIDHLAGFSTAVIAMKGVEPSDEIATLPAPWRVTGLRALHVPFVAAQRCAVVLRRALPHSVG